MIRGCALQKLTKATKRRSRRCSLTGRVTQPELSRTGSSLPLLPSCEKALSPFGLELSGGWLLRGHQFDEGDSWIAPVKVVVPSQIGMAHQELACFHRI